MAIDVIGLKVYREGECEVKTLGTDGKRRMWRKLHLAVDDDTHDIVAAALSLSNVTDAEVFLYMLKQLRRRVTEVSTDGTYDTSQCYEAISVKRALPIPKYERGFLGKISST